MNKSLRRKIIIPSIYICSILIVAICVLVVGKSMSHYKDGVDNTKHTKKEVFEKETPVMSEETAIIKPYKEETVKIGKYFYDYEGEKNSQEKSLIYYENTYMQNSGVDYVNEKSFEVLSVLDGEIIDVKNDKTLGNIVEVKHDKEIVTIYQGLEKVNVKKGDKLKQGAVLGISGTSKVNPDYKSYVHFEVFVKGELMNPENFYNLNIKDLK